MMLCSWVIGSGRLRERFGWSGPPAELKFRLTFETEMILELPSPCLLKWCTEILFQQPLHYDVITVICTASYLQYCHRHITFQLNDSCLAGLNKGRTANVTTLILCSPVRFVSCLLLFALQITWRTANTMPLTQWATSLFGLVFRSVFSLSPKFGLTEKTERKTNPKSEVAQCAFCWYRGAAKAILIHECDCGSAFGHICVYVCVFVCLSVLFVL